MRRCRASTIDGVPESHGPRESFGTLDTSRIGLDTAEIRVEKRNANRYRVSRRQVVGDVLRIQVGDVIPVDGVLLESTDVPSLMRRCAFESTFFFSRARRDARARAPRAKEKKYFDARALCVGSTRAARTRVWRCACAFSLKVLEKNTQVKMDESSMTGEPLLARVRRVFFHFSPRFLPALFFSPWGTPE